MKVKVVIDLKDVRREDLERIAKIGEIAGGWKAVVKEMLEFGLFDLDFYYNVDYTIEDVDEVK